MRCAARSKCSAAWPSATPTFRSTGASRCAWASISATSSSTPTTSTSMTSLSPAASKPSPTPARYVLDASVRKAGNRVRITGQLIEAATGTHVWAQRYDRALDEIFELQDEMTLSVMGAIEPQVRHAEVERARRKRPESLDAYDL